MSRGKGKNPRSRSNPSPEALALWSDKITVPEGKGLKLYLRNQADRDISDLRIYYDPPGTKYFVPRVTTIKTYSIMEIDLLPEDLAKLPVEYSLHFRADGYDPVLATRVQSNWFVVRVTGKAQQAKITFLDPEGKPYYPATFALVNKRTGELWAYDGNPDGVGYIPKRYYTAEQVGDYCIQCHYEEPGTKKFAIALIDDYDFFNYEVRAPLVERVHGKVTVKFERFEDFTKAVYGMLPDPLKTVADAIGTLFGWASEQMMRLAVTFLVGYYIKTQSTEVTAVDFDLGKGELYVHYAIRHHGVLAALAAIPLWLKIIMGLGAAIAFIWAISVKIIEPWSEVRKAEEATKRTKHYEETMSTLKDLYERGAITKETLDEAIRGLSHSANLAKDATPPPPWWEKLADVAPTVVVGGLILGGFYVFGRFILPAIRPGVR